MFDFERPNIEVVEISEQNLLPSPTLGLSDKQQDRYVYAIGKIGDSVKLLLDPEKLLHDDIAVLGKVSSDEDTVNEE